MEINWRDLTDDLMEDHEVDDVIKMAKERFKAICFIMGANESQFGSLKRILNNNSNLGKYMYPTEMTTAYELLLNTAGILDARARNNRNQRTNISFAQRGQSSAVVPGTNGITYSNMRCYE